MKRKCSPSRSPLPNDPCRKNGVPSKGKLEPATTHTKKREEKDMNTKNFDTPCRYVSEVPMSGYQFNLPRKTNAKEKGKNTRECFDDIVSKVVS